MKVKLLKTVDVNGVKYDPVTIEYDGHVPTAPDGKHFHKMLNEFSAGSPLRVSFRKHVLKNSLGQTAFYESGNILNFGKVTHLGQTGYIISSNTNIPTGVGWHGICMNFYIHVLHSDGRYRARWWYFVPEEYCELELNVCWRKLLKDNPYISERPEQI